MRANLFLFIVIISFGLVFQGCEKEENNFTPTDSNQALSTTKKNAINNKNNVGDTTYISEVNFEAEFDSFAETFFTNHPHGLINIIHIPEESLYALTTEEEGPIDPISGERIVCRGERSNVFACAQRFATYNVFGCIAEASPHECNCGVWIAVEIC